MQLKIDLIYNNKNKKIKNMFENRRWLVIPAEEVKNVDFNQVHESSIDSLRYSVDGTKTFIKYDVMIILADISNSFVNMSDETITSITKYGTYGRPSIYKEEYPEYNHADILTLLSTEEWSKPMEINMVRPQ